MHGILLSVTLIKLFMKQRLAYTGVQKKPNLPPVATFIRMTFSAVPKEFRVGGEAIKIYRQVQVYSSCTLLCLILGGSN